MSNDRMRVVYAAGMALLLLAVVVVGILGVRRLSEIERQAIERETARLAHEAEMEAQEESRRRLLTPTFVPATKTKHTCFAVNDLVTCYFTNLTKEPIVTCTQGLVSQKEAAGVRLYSAPMCSGPIQALSTGVVSSPWSGGRAVDICASGKYLDWDKCNFTNIDFDPKP